MADEKDPVGYFLRERYTICFSNTTDPFMAEEKTYRCTEAFLKWCKKRCMPLWIQTKGGVLLEDFDRYKDLIVAGKDAVYITVTTLDDEISRKIEPGARGIWLEQLHFTASQMSVLPVEYKEFCSKANLAPMYYLGEIKKWYIETEPAGIDFYPTPQTDEYFGYRAKFPECADPAWFGEGSKTFSYNFDLMREISSIAHEGEAPYDGNLKRRNNGKPTVVFWNWIEDFLQKSGCPNPVLKVDPFWVPFNAKQLGDYRHWKAKLGKEAPLYSILKYFYNEPETSELFFWISRISQVMYDYDNDNVVWDEETDALISVFNPKNRHDFTPLHDFKKFKDKMNEDKNSYIGV
jgi:hypothetical protein